jgi:hypothetical protein
MLQVIIEQRGVDTVVSYIERTKQRIFQKMREGMEEAMQGLAGEAVYQASAAGIHNKTGQLFTDILNSPKVGENADAIFGRVRTKSEMTSGGRKFEGYLGTALDEGFRVPATKKTKVFQFAAADGDTIYSRGHVAFDVKPHPFLARAKEEFTAPIFEIIERRVAEAYQ